MKWGGVLLVAAGLVGAVAGERRTAEDWLLAASSLFAGGAVLATARLLPARGRALLSAGCGVAVLGLLVATAGGLIPIGETAFILLPLALFAASVVGLFAGNIVRSASPDFAPAAWTGAGGAVCFLLPFALAPFTDLYTALLGDEEDGVGFFVAIWFPGMVAGAAAAAMTLWNLRRRGKPAADLAWVSLMLFYCALGIVLGPVVLLALPISIHFGFFFGLAHVVLTTTGALLLAAGGLAELLRSYAGAVGGSAPGGGGG